MSVKKMGSKLAQGVRQVQSQQVKAQSPTADTSEPVAPAKPDEKRPVQQAVAGGERSLPKLDDRLHPRRIWPD